MSESGPTTGWHRVKPQWVRHVDGYDVYSAGRFHVAYEEESAKILVAAERVEARTELSPVVVERQLADGTTSAGRRADPRDHTSSVIAGLAATGEPSWLHPTGGDTPSRAVGGSTQVLLMGFFFVALGTKRLLDTSTAATLAGLSGAWLRGRVVSRVLTAVALLAALGCVALTVSALP